MSLEYLWHSKSSLAFFPLAYLDVTKQKDLSGFYRHLLNQRVGEEEVPKCSFREARYDAVRRGFRYKAASAWMWFQTYRNTARSRQGVL